MPMTKTQHVFRGDRMSGWRAMLNITQQRLAELVGMTRMNISMIEGDRAQPSIERLSNIAVALGVTSDWLLGLSDEPCRDADKRYPGWRNYVEG